MKKPDITKFVMEDVRCFAGQQEFNIRPITFLVGENSTGKSTAMGCFQVLADSIALTDPIALSRNLNLDFNVEPYSMGSFKDIVTRTRPVGEKFKLGFRFEVESNEKVDFTISIVEKEKSAEPILECMNLKFHDGEIHLTQDRSQQAYRKEFFVVDTKKTNINKKIFHIRCNMGFSINPMFVLNYISFTLDRQLKIKSSSEGKALHSFLSEKDSTIRKLNFSRPFSFAPVRSRPKRTYDPIKELEDPEGSDIPMLLMRMKSSKNIEWQRLQQQLVAFGEDSGLFDKIEVKKHGKSMSDPFQIQVKVRGPRSNIMDVGYGVSQILPILVRIFSSKYPLFFLLQQPEVHLHPRGQAELMSLFVNTVNTKKHSFIIETHSDYIIDRARIEIQRGNIPPENVSLIYLEPKGAHVKVHNIKFDKKGNLTEVPGSYREFFLKETDRLLWNSED